MRTPYTFDRVVRMVIVIVVLTLTFFLLRKLSNVLLPFLVAWLIAYLLHPVVWFFQVKLKVKSRLLSVIITLALLLTIIGSSIALLFPVVTAEFSRLSQLVADYARNMDMNSILPVAWQNEIKRYLSRIDFQTLLQDQNIMNIAKRLIPQLWGVLNNSLDLLLGMAVIVVVFLYLFFIMLDYERISNGMVNIIPPKYKQLIMGIINDVKEGMNRYFRGQALVALIVGILSAIGFSIIRLPLAVVLGLLIGVFTLVPYLKLVGLVPGVFLALLKSAETGQSLFSVIAGVLVVFAIVQAIEDLLLTPFIMGKVTGLNPAVIMLSLSIWGSLLGMLGMIIALPVTTLLISYYRRFVLERDSIDSIAEEEPEEVNNNASSEDS